MFIRIVFFIAFVVQIPSWVSAQSFYASKRNRDLILNAGTGVARYYGELANPNTIGKLKPNINVGLEYLLGSRFSARVDATWFQLTGSDEFAVEEGGRRTRNLSFFSNNLELNALGTFYILPNEGKFNQRRSLNFYGFGGIGLLYFNPKTKFQGETVALAPLRTEGVSYSRVQPVIPLGGGIQIKVNPFINLAIEGAYRFTFTDYLDDISSRQYPDPSTLSSPLAVALSDRRRELNPNATSLPNIVRGNPNSGDGYFILTAKAQFYLPTSFGGSQKFYGAKRKSYRNKGGMYKNRSPYRKKSRSLYKRR